MESQRSLLIIGLLLVSFLLWIEYQEATAPQAPQTEVNTLYIAQSGLIGKDGPDASGRPKYNATSTEFKMQGESVLDVPLTWQSANGLVVTKTFSFASNSHTIAVNYNIQNNSANALQMQQFAQLKQTLNEQKGGGSMFMPTFRGAAYGTQDDIYEKLKFDNIEDEKLRVATVGGWTGMLEHYFVSAWIPPQEQTNTLYARIVQNTAIIGYTGESVVINSGDTAVINSQLYVGPKDQDVLKELAEGLNLTVDYGILWWLALPLFSLLQLIQSVVINWGLAIIIITLIVKGAMYWLTKKLISCTLLGTT